MLQIPGGGGERGRGTHDLEIIGSSLFILYMWVFFLFVFKQKECFMIPNVFVILHHIKIFFTYRTEANIKIF